MITPTVKFVFDRKKRASEGKPGVVDMVVSLDGRRVIRSTGVSVLPSEWDCEKMVINRCDASFINARLLGKRKELMELVGLQMARGGDVSLDEVMAGSRARSLYKGDFVEFVEERMHGRKDIRLSTRRSHNRLVGTLRRYGKIQRFCDVTSRAIRDWDNWLHGQYGKQSTVYTYHKIMKVYVNEARRQGYILKDPYDGFRVDKGLSEERRFLSEEDLERLAGIVVYDEAVMRARDVFLFQCYTGLAYADLENFDFSKVEERDGRFVLRGRRQKTGVDFHIVLLSPALEILRRYGFRLPLVSNQKYNQTLKTVAAHAGIRMRLTSHCGRHTFATWALNRNVPVAVLKSMLGHSNTRTTEIYAKILNRSVDKAFDLLENNI